MSVWQENEEGDFPFWARELDERIHSLNHRRACVWLDELTGAWTWEIESFHGNGNIASGTAGSREQAMAVVDDLVAR
ncbi:hypothetical protein [Paraburkholderia bannensis]|uniref:hypothetical protein n=1 Tax=Paraburkholderia bannensis TaxID=765414 RepID=UPI002AB7EA83|nr:hypothetical protein [Paraburkholderia bannensis]